jgi:hypothetical protein
VNADSITNGNEPSISSSGQKGTSSSLGGWTTTTITAGDVLGFNVDTCTVFTKVELQLKVTM